MLVPMLDRVFLGWDGPFLERAASWLVARRDELPSCLVLVPTSQSGRRLREALAEQAGGALLSPRIATPGSLLSISDPNVAADWMERVAWLEMLGEIDDWEPFQELFPQAPEGDADWAYGLATEWVGLRRSLQENGLTLQSAAKKLAGSVENGRWKALSEMESLMERKLQFWGLRSRSKVLAAGVKIPAGIRSVVLAGITEMPPLLEKTLHAWDGKVTALIAAPEGEEDAFSQLGRPLKSWTQRILPWPTGDHGSVTLVADPRQEAVGALRTLAENHTPSNEVALGCSDAVTGDLLAQTFKQAGWPAFHPAAKSVPGGLLRWFRVWSAWLKDPKLATLMDLFSMPETAAWVGESREETASALSRLRDKWMVLRPHDLRHRLQNQLFSNEPERLDVAKLLSAVTEAERWRNEFLSRNFPETMTGLLEVLARVHQETESEAGVIRDWVASAEPVMRRVKREAAFWIDLMLEEIPCPAPEPPDGRVIDVQGWLELLYEPGRHLVLCGMNEGKVPPCKTGDPWLGDSAGSQLGLIGNADRAARDAFLYHTMLEARRDGGRVDIFCSKSGSGGEALLPSRLLLAAHREELPHRVKFLFQEVEPPEAGMRWHADWKWQPHALEKLEKLSVTSFSNWLACPFRFYLKHVLRMQTPEPERVEWSARDFGNIAHAILERWGRDKIARDLTDPAALHAWLCAALDRVVNEWFGKNPPLSVRLQTESLRQRFAWFAQVQAGIRADGWETIGLEQRFRLEIGSLVVSGTYDRLDRHCESGALRVIDYKTGKVDSVEREHRAKLTTSTHLPPHTPANCPVIHSAESSGKSTSFRWKNLQLPLYALALKQSGGVLPGLCYFHFGATESLVKLDEWKDFTEQDLSAASDCAAWIIEQIANGVFWPPAEKVTHDDFEALATGRRLEERCDAPATARDQPAD